MKAINQYFSDSIKDAKTVLPALKDAYNKLLVKYNEETHPKLRILDNLIILSLVTFVVQMIYMVVVGTKEPLNAILAGVFCSLG